MPGCGQPGSSTCSTGGQSARRSAERSGCAMTGPAGARCWSGACTCTTRAWVEAARSGDRHVGSLLYANCVHSTPCPQAIVMPTMLRTMRLPDALRAVPQHHVCLTQHKEGVDGRSTAFVGSLGSSRQCCSTGAWRQYAGVPLPEQATCCVSNCDAARCGKRCPVGRSGGSSGRRRERRSWDGRGS